MVRGLGLQRVANENNALIVLPQSGIMELLGFRFFLWDLVVETDGDLVLFDDLRACAAEQHDIDLPATSAFGFSGGALFTTVLIRERGDAFAAAVEASGGADISVPIWTTPGAAYGSPPTPLPTLLMSGGEADVWPDPSLTLVDFTAATDTLEAGLVTDGHTVVRCRHSAGHTIPQRGYQLALEWAFGHRFATEMKPRLPAVRTLGTAALPPALVALVEGKRILRTSHIARHLASRVLATARFLASFRTGSNGAGGGDGVGVGVGGGAVQRTLSGFGSSGASGEYGAVAAAVGGAVQRTLSGFGSAHEPGDGAPPPSLSGGELPPKTAPPSARGAPPSSARGEPPKSAPPPSPTSAIFSPTPIRPSATSTPKSSSAASSPSLPLANFPSSTSTPL
jgi:predicted esterase